MRDDTKELKSLVGEVLVVDSDSPYIYIGTMKEVTDSFIILSDVDVHDATETSTTKERYAIDARRHGTRVNRREVLIRKDRVLSLSKLSDVVEY